MWANIKFKKLTDTAKPFHFVKENDACADIYSDADIVIKPYETVVIPSGIALEIPPMFYGEVRGRSGNASRGILTHIGTIDSNYRGNVGVIMYNSTNEPFYIRRGDRVAQFTMHEKWTITMTEAEELSETERGEHGFGSSGTR